MIRERKEFAPGEMPYGNLLRIKFKDGEVMVGTSSGYDLDRLGFFFFPAFSRFAGLAFKALPIELR